MAKPPFKNPNRMSSSGALVTHGIWQKTIGYDPYAPISSEEPVIDPKAQDLLTIHARQQAETIMDRAKSVYEVDSLDRRPGACKKCNKVGHLTFQCRNFVKLKDAKSEKDIIEAIEMETEFKRYLLEDSAQKEKKKSKKDKSSKEKKRKDKAKKKNKKKKKNSSSSDSSDSSSSSSSSSSSDSSDSEPSEKKKNQRHLQMKLGTIK